MKKKISTWKTIENLAEEVKDGLDQDEYEVVASLLSDLAFKTVMYAAKKCGFKFRRTWPNVKPILPQLTPPLQKDYTKLLLEARGINKEARYADDDWEFDTDDLRAIAEEVLELVEDVRQMAP